MSGQGTATRIGALSRVRAGAVVLPSSSHGWGALLFPETAQLAPGDAIAVFRSRPLVVLSPHFDDACFSLGGFLSVVGRGRLVNIFTDTVYLPRERKDAPQDRFKAFETRNGEDFAFGERCGLTRYNLGCEEPALRGRRPSQLRYVGDDVSRIAAPLLSTLERLAEPLSTRGYLFCPLGIGQHCNHRATVETVLRHLPEIRRHYDVLFYEDQPYAARPLDRFRALVRVNRRAPLATRHVYVPAWEAKKNLIELYPSQLRNAPQQARFRPAAPWPYAPHEAFWSTAGSN